MEPCSGQCMPVGSSLPSRSLTRSGCHSCWVPLTTDCPSGKQGQRRLAGWGAADRDQVAVRQGYSSFRLSRSEPALFGGLFAIITTLYCIELVMVCYGQLSPGAAPAHALYAEDPLSFS